MAIRGDEPAIEALITAALAEDRIEADCTSLAIVPEDAHGRARLVARAPGVFAGAFLLAPAPVIARSFPDLEINPAVEDGARLHPGQIIALIEGSARQILGLERTLLNFLQRLGGIATMTSRYVAACTGTATRIQETRKTCPGWRRLDKYAVAVGGGLNHRESLEDQVLVKENHLVFLEDSPRSPEAVERAVHRARDGAGGRPVEIEVETLEQFDAALRARPEIIMLDELSDDAMREAVQRRDAAGAATLLEASGGVTLERVAALAALGVDRISVGALTHSVRALDLALEIGR